MRNSLFFRSVVIPSLLLMYQHSVAQSWNLAGNSDATSSSKLGTTNAIPLGLFTNNLERMRIDTAGRIGIGTIVPNTSALLDLTSTTTGILVPRMTLAQKNAITSPPLGLLIFQTNGTKGFYFYDGSWKPVTPSVSGLANRTLSNLTAPTAINADLLPGTTNAQDLGSTTRNWKDLYLDGKMFQGLSRVLSIDSATSSIYLGKMSGSIAKGEDNVAIGQQALQLDTTGRSNTAVGVHALQFNTSGDLNSAFGANALARNNFGIFNCAFGASASLFNTSGSENSAFGASASNHNTKGSHNTAIGYGALSSDTTQNDNTAVGYLAASSSVSSRSTFLGSGATSTSNVDNAMALGFNASVNASNKVVIGNTSVQSIGGHVGWSTFSDGRFKKNIKENVPGLAFVNQLRPVTYTLDVDGIDRANDKATSQVLGRDGLKQSEAEQLSQEEIAGKQAKSKIIYTGFVAQEVEQTAKKLNYDFSGVDAPKNSNDFYALRYGDFVVPLVKAVQELSKKNEELEERLKKLEELVAKNGLTANSYADLSKASLEQNSPNPFNSATIIRYHLHENVGNAKVVITDMSGKTIKSISLNSKGNGQLTLSSGTLAAGSYNYTLWIDNKQVDSKKMVIIK
jgi:hypothetical protein